MTKDQNMGAFADFIDVLSVWELSHRWRGYNPDETDPQCLPPVVQDTLRFVCQGLMYERIRSCSERGVVYKNHNNLLSYEAFEAGMEPDADADAEDSTWYPDDSTPWEQLSDSERYQAYEEYEDRVLSGHNKAVSGLESVVRFRQFDKSRLERTYVLHETFVEDLAEYAPELPAPEFWSVPNTPASEPKPRDNQLAKAECQAIARLLWDQNPDLTIADIIRHKAIREFTKASHYSEKARHRWVSEVDTRPPEEKVGRPTKKPLSD